MHKPRLAIPIYQFFTRSPLQSVAEFILLTRRAVEHMAKQGPTIAVQLRSVRGPSKFGMPPNKQTIAGSRNSRNSSETRRIVCECIILAQDIIRDIHYAPKMSYNYSRGQEQELTIANYCACIFRSVPYLIIL